MAGKNKQEQVFNGNSFTIGTIGVLLIILIVWTLVHFVYESPNLVFYSMLNNSLSTSSFSKKVVERTGSSADERLISVQTGAKNIATQRETQTFTTLNSSSVVTQSVGTPTTDYAKFISINSSLRNKAGTLLDYSPVIGVWTKDVPSPNLTSGKLFSDTLLGSVVPIGNVSPAQRNDLMKYIKQEKIYNIEGKVKRGLVDGHSEYTYAVSIDLPKYVVMLQKFGKDLGLKLSPINTSKYTGVLEAAYIHVNPLTRQLIEVDYIGSKTSETFSSFGTKYNINTPSKTIPLSQIKTQLSAINNN